MAADNAHHQPRTGAGITEIKHRIRRAQTTNPDAMNAPFALADAVDFLHAPETKVGFVGTAMPIELLPLFGALLVGLALGAVISLFLALRALHVVLILITAIIALAILVSIIRRS